MSSPSSRPMPGDRINLQHKKKLAKELLKAVQRLDGQQALRFTWNVPRFRGQSGQDVIQAGVKLSDAQHVIARESGFDSWPKMVHYVEQLDADPHGPAAAFETAVRALIRGDVDELTRLLRAHPSLATMRSARQHRAVLPHYLAANGVENENQISPPNAPAVARVLFDAGADAIVDTTADIYGGGSGSTPLVALVTSVHPHQAGVQAELVRLFCAAGARVDGIEDDGMPLTSALGFRYPRAAEALAECGARVDNLPTAAALGRSDIVRQMLDPGCGRSSTACAFHNPDLILPHSTAPHPSATVEQAFVFACMGGHRDVAANLLDHGVDIHAGPRAGITALHESAYQGNADMVFWLLDRGADLTRREQRWESTAIGWADGGGHPDLIDALFQHPHVDFLDAVEYRRYDLVERKLHADPTLANAPDHRGGALRHAAFLGDLRLARLLIDHGADVTLRNDTALSALDYARKGGHQDMVELLQSKSTNDRNSA